MPSALNWLAAAEQCFADEYGSLRQGLLTSIFALVIGMERIFHLDEMEDAGFARLCGDRRCPSRYTVGAWRRRLSWYEVDAFCRRTCPWHLLHNEDALVSFDEHTIPRWTRKYHIGKGYVTTRNKYMRCEKLFTGYDLIRGRFLSVRGTPGNVNLQELAVPLAEQVLRQGRPRSLHALFDAGAGKSDAGVRALWDLVDQHADLDVTLRALSLPTSHAGLEAIAQRPVRIGRRPRSVCGRSTQRSPSGRNADGAQGRRSGTGDSHHSLPRNSPRPQEGPLAPTVYDEHG